MTKENKEKVKKRVLVLCVDRDGDVSTKIGIRTPLIGRKENLNAAVSLALEDPEEPDANAMFEAISLHDRLQSKKKQEENFEIATITGSGLGGVDSDRKIVSELKNLLNSFPANEVILVTDGYSDEAVLPLIESRVPVLSVRRVVIKHSESIEETAALFARYLRTIVENPRYSRIVLGVPGILFLILGILALFDWVNYYLISIVVIFGIFMLVKGFGIDRTFKNFCRWIREYTPPPLSVQILNYSTIAGILCIAISIYSGWANITTNIIIPPNLATWLNILPQTIGYFIKGSMDLTVIGICAVLSGRAIRLYFKRDTRVLRNLALIISFAWSRWILDGTADILINPGMGFEPKFVFAIIIGILIGIASVLIIVFIHRSFPSFFKEIDSQVE